MTPDLRPHGTYPKPLPRALLFILIGSTVAMVLSGVFAGGVWRQLASVNRNVAVQKGEIDRARERIRSFDSAVNGLQASREIRASLETWRTGSKITTTLQAAAIVACAETEVFLGELAKKDAELTPRNTTGRNRRGQTTEVSAPVLVIRSMTVTARPEAGGVELVMEIYHAGESRALVPQLNTRLAQFTPNGLSLTSFKSDDRANSLNVVTVWKNSGNSMALVP